MLEPGTGRMRAWNPAARNRRHRTPDDPLKRTRRPIRGLQRLAAALVGPGLRSARVAGRTGPGGRPGRRPGAAPARAVASGPAGHRVRGGILARKVRAHQRDLLRGLRQRLLPSSAGRTTMCPTELLWDPSRPPSIRLLPIETRAKEASVAEYKNYGTSGSRSRWTSPQPTGWWRRCRACRR